MQARQPLSDLLADSALVGEACWVHCAVHVSCSSVAALIAVWDGGDNVQSKNIVNR